jgi:transposase
MSISERMHMPEPVRRIEVFTGAGRRRSWSTVEKAAIVDESYAAGETVCGVARRHGLTPQQLFAWRRLVRRASAEVSSLFVPAVIETTTAVTSVVAAAPRRARRRRKPSGIELEIGGVEIRVGADATPRAIAAVIRALKAGL